MDRFRKSIAIFFSLFVLLTTFLLISDKQVSADENFGVDANIEYKVLDGGTTAVTHTITIKNRSTYEYAKNYILKLSNLEPKNIRAFEEGTAIPLETSKRDQYYQITLKFNDAVTGKDSSRTFIITYEEEGIAQKSGEVWEIAIPKILTKYDGGKVVLSVPESFGAEAIISPSAQDKKNEEGRFIYVFEGADLERSGINAVFGKFQVYSFKLLYHLKNENDKNSTESFAIPPDTTTQRVFYNNIDPAPTNIEIDEDGNWVAYFNLPPQKSQDVTVEGFAQVFADPIKFLAPFPSTILANLKPQEYWEVNDPAIIQIANELRTPQEIYDFVVENLNYNYKKVGPESQRLGAKKVLSSTNDAICTEFTDLFIAISRAAGIPAREINGYAYSDNSKLQPISLISDVLHSWPEYWDEKRQNWVPVDPTWESTSKMDYFNKFDLKHIAFVIHGKSSTQPLSAGSYKSENISKDVFVEFAQLPPEGNNNLEISYYVAKKFNFFKKKLVIDIKNKKTSAQYNLVPKITLFDTDIKEGAIPVLPPFATYSTQVDIPIGLFAIKSPDIATVSINNTQKVIYINKANFAIQQLLVFLSLLLLFLVIFGVKTKRIDLIKHFNKIRSHINNVIKTEKT